MIAPAPETEVLIGFPFFALGFFLFAIVFLCCPGRAGRWPRSGLLAAGHALQATGRAQAMKAGRAQALKAGLTKAVKANQSQAVVAGRAATCRRRMMKAYPRVSSGLIGGGKQWRRWRRNLVRHPGGSLATWTS